VTIIRDRLPPAHGDDPQDAHRADPHRQDAMISRRGADCLFRSALTAFHSSEYTGMRRARVNLAGGMG
jgi:hypothetical protein